MLIEKIRQLPPLGLAEVEDFVDFCARTHEERQSLMQAAGRASEASLAAV